MGFFQILFTSSLDEVQPPKKDNKGELITDAEKIFYRQRFSNNTYTTFGSDFTNSPGKGQRIIERKDLYLTLRPLSHDGPRSDDRQANRQNWDGGNPIVPWVNDPHMEYDRIWGEPWHKDLFTAAAFWAVVQENSSLINTCISDLIHQAQRPGIQYNLPRWQPNATKQLGSSTQYLWQANPAFFEGEFLCSRALIYGWLKPHMSSSQKLQVENWLLAGAEFFRQNIEIGALEGYFNSTLDRQNKQMNNEGRRALRLSETWAEWITHQNGYVLTRGSVVYNNRLMSQASAIGVIGAVTGNTTYINYGKQVFDEWLTFGMFPDGTQTEFHRRGEFGIHYGGINLNMWATFAYSLWKMLDDDYGFTFSTSAGVTNTITTDGRTPDSTVGGPKSLINAIKGYSRYFRSQENGGFAPRYSTRGDQIDGYVDSSGTGYRDTNSNGSFKYSYMWGRYFQHHMYAAAVCYKYTQAVGNGDTELRDFYRMNTSAGYPGLQPEGSIQNIGYHKSMVGNYATIPDVAFMYFD